MLGTPDILRRRTGDVLCVRRALHVVLRLDWIEQSMDSCREDLRRLQNVRDAFHGIVLTICSERSFPETQSILANSCLLEPEHLLTEQGLVLHHHMPGRGWERDQVYPDRFTSRRRAREGNDTVFDVGLEYLDMHVGVPRPLLVAGHLDLDLACLQLADLPVVGISRLPDAEMPSWLVTRAFRTLQSDLGDVIPILLTYFTHGDPIARPSMRIWTHRHMNPITTKRILLGGWNAPS